ncbi:MAG: dioxygenase [Pseudomonadota bacterium]
MAEASLSQMVAAANAPLLDPERNRQIGTGPARFELYHFALSVCSHKVRTVLAEKGASYRSHDIQILPPGMENYHPDYVRLRMQGGRGREFVAGYTGRSSTTTEGFDPCVVPTLVDLETEEVLVDSKQICAHIDRVWDGGERLLPANLTREIERELAIVDGTPHVAVLYGAHPEGDFRPEMLRQNMPGIHDYKIMKLMEGRSLAVGHPRLIAAYDAKIRKEASARAYVATPDLMRSATREILAVIAELDGRLADGRRWICGEAFTMADVQWAVSLFRLKWLGMGFAWEGGHKLNDEAHGHVAAYAGRLFERQSFRDAVIYWPGNPPSEYVSEFYAKTNGHDPAPMPERPPGAHGRDIREENLTGVVLDTMKGARTPRAQKVLNAFTRHLHAFLEEVEPTEEEWEQAIDFLTRTGHLCTGGRQEFVLLSDVMGATARVDMINHRWPDGATENSVLGPFFVEDRPAFPNGADISAGIKGEPLVVSGRILDLDGAPIGGARVDVWHSDDQGSYDIMMANVDGAAMRGLFRSDHDGRFWFTSILPTSYPIPSDGTVGELLRAADRSIIRPGHVHVRVEAPGYHRLTTMLFVDGDPYLDSDPVFGVKDSLVVPFEKRSDLRLPDGQRAPSPCYAVDYDFVLTRTASRRA